MLLFKAAGSALVLISSTIFGIVMGNYYTNRPSILRRMISALQFLETEITYGFAPLPDALRNVACSLKSSESHLFIRTAALISPSCGLSVQEAWKRSLAESYERIGLSERDVEIMLSLGNSLGISDREDQIKHLALVRENLSRCMDEAQREGDKMTRLWRSLSICAGLIIIILLI